MSEQDAQKPIDPTRLQPQQLVMLLMKAGSKLATLSAIEKNFAAGAPRNGDGTIHLMHYTAWLVKQMT